MADGGMFKYFDAGPDEMSGLRRVVEPCHFCGATGRAFRLDGATCDDVPDRAGKFGCPACLVRGRFSFWHDTELGLLLETGLESPLEAPPAFRAEALEELCRTPRIVSWQQERWLTHCDDFMVYLGVWAPSDFVRHAGEAGARDLFLRMTREPAQRDLWDASCEPGASTPPPWYATYYAFRCLHCGALAGNWDSP
jgi:uncharacterized protein CbrC (UPF0167 family)